MNHWALKYIGKGWHERDGFGPDRFHCWGLVWFIYKQELKIELPQFLGVGAYEFRDVTKIMTRGVEEAEAHPGLWLPTTREAARDFTVVPLSNGGRAIHHVGLWLEVDGGMVLHANGEAGVIAEPFQSFKNKWHRILFLNYNHG